MPRTWEARLFNAKEDVEAQYYRSGGKFRPLDVWTRKGYDADAIKTKSAPEEIREHPALGTTYRLNILELGDRGENGHMSQHISTATSKEKLQQKHARPAKLPGVLAALELTEMQQTTLTVLVLTEKQKATQEVRRSLPITPTRLMSAAAAAAVSV